VSQEESGRAAGQFPNWELVAHPTAKDAEAKDSKEGRDQMTASGGVWIWVEKPIASSKLTIVDELIDATVLKTADAEQIAHKANEEYPKYRWHRVAARSRGKFVVGGERRAA
jgi:hypothetical protein